MNNYEPRASSPQNQKKKKNKIQQNTKAKSAKNSIQIQNSSWGRMRHVHVTLRRQKLRILFNKIQIVAFTGKADWLGFAVTVTIISIYTYQYFADFLSTILLA